MSDSDHVHAQNAESTQRLRELVEQLRTEDYAHDLGGGWTVSVALAHLAFWDARHSTALQHFHSTGALLHEDPAVNPALALVATSCEAPTIGALTVAACDSLDQDLAQLTSAQLLTILDGGFPHTIERWHHRDEHIAQIRAALT